MRQRVDTVISFIRRRSLGAVSTVLLSLILVGGSSGTALPQQKNSSAELKKLVRQASKSARLGDLKGAERILRQAASLETHSHTARIELALVLAKQRNLREAYELALNACNQEPKNARAFAVLGHTMLTGGRFAEARLMFVNALTLDRGDHLARAGYGMLNFYENNVAECLENLREAVFLRPQEPDYLFSLAQVAARSEQFKEAADAYQAFLDISGAADEDRRERIKGLIDLLKYLGRTSGLYKLSGKERTSVRFELIGNRPIVNVRINGSKEALRFVLDTGSSITVISNETAKRLRIKPVARGGWGKGLGGDGRFDIVYGFLRELSIGDVGLRNVPVFIREFHNRNSEFDGYIGLALISKFLTTVDYGEQTFSLVRKTEVAEPLRDHAESVQMPLRLTSSGFLSGEVQLQGVEGPLNFVVDTGASVSVIADTVARSPKFRPYRKDKTLRVIGSAGITDEMPIFSLPSVSVGKDSRKDITAVALDLGIINEASGFEQAGILGGNFLRNYRLIFDFKKSLVTFTPISARAADEN